MSELGVVEVSDLSLLCRDSSKRPVCGCENYLSALVKLFYLSLLEISLAKHTIVLAHISICRLGH